MNTDINVVRIGNGWLAYPANFARGEVVEWDQALYAKNGIELGKLIVAHYCRERLTGVPNDQINEAQAGLPSGLQRAP